MQNPHVTLQVDGSKENTEKKRKHVRDNHFNSYYPKTRSSGHSNCHTVISLKQPYFLALHLSLVQIIP